MRAFAKDGWWALRATVGPDVRNEVKKLGCKEQRELAELPDRIEILEETQAELQNEVSGAYFCEQTPHAIRAGLDALNEFAIEIERAYERWDAPSERGEGA
jgi:ATP-binding cassette subfamily F protein uup